LGSITKIAGRSSTVIAQTFILGHNPTATEIRYIIFYLRQLLYRDVLSLNHVRHSGSDCANPVCSYSVRNSYTFVGPTNRPSRNSGLERRQDDLSTEAIVTDTPAFTFTALPFFLTELPLPPSVTVDNAIPAPSIPALPFFNTGLPLNDGYIIIFCHHYYTS